MKRNIVILLLFAVQFLCAQAKQEPFGSEIKKFEQMDSANAPTQKGQIMVYGSSTVRFWKTADSDFAYLGLKVVNRGFGGSQMPDALRYFERIVVPHAPSWLFLYEGDNDLAAGRSVDSVFMDYKKFIEKVKVALPKTQLVVFSAKHSPSRMVYFERQKQLNTLLKNHVKTVQNVYFIDTATPMLNEKNEPDAKYFLKDMLHMNESGYALWTREVQAFYRGFKKN
jgi:lysophospholipase L1-like esterase